MSRSENMARIRSKNTKPEMIVRRALWADGLRYRLHVRSLPGCPDIVFTGRRAVVQVRGCWWHLHPGCPAAKIPKTRAHWWKAKLSRNVERDAETDTALAASGWKVFVVWECETGNVERLAALVGEIRALPTLRPRPWRLGSAPRPAGKPFWRRPISERMCGPVKYGRRRMQPEAIGTALRSFRESASDSVRMTPPEKSCRNAPCPLLFGQRHCRRLAPHP